MKDEKIRFSIIIALAPDRKPEVVESLKELDYQKGAYEIIVEKGDNTSENRNRGVKRARGEIVAFIDSDAMVDREWLKNAEDFFSNHPEVDILGGPQLTPESDSLFGKISGYALGSLFGGAVVRNRYRKGKMNMASDERELSSANLFCRKKVLADILFNPRFWPGEDPEFFNQCQERGFRIAYAPQIVVYHKRRGSLFSFARQIFRYAYVRPKVKKTKKRRFYSFLFYVPALFFCYLLLLPFLYDINRLFIMPLYFYLILNFAFAAGIGVKQKSLSALLRLPLIFLIIHLAYGAGIIFGMLERNGKTAD